MPPAGYSPSGSRSGSWTAALVIALLLSGGWLLLPGICVVLPAGTSGSLFSRSVLLQLLYPFERDWVYPLNLLHGLGPIILVLVAMCHWWRKVQMVRVVTIFYAIGLSIMFALHPARRLMDFMIIGVVGTWACILLVALRSKASPGSALVALMALQLGTVESFVGLGPYRGLPYWCLMTCLGIIFLYGVLHYTRKFRHKVLGRFTTIHRRPPPQSPTRQTLEGGQWKA
jgi:hypothetical protein